MSAEIEPITVSYIRGGTSKGVFVRLGTLPSDGNLRDRLALGLLGSPDPMQLDGLGGTYSSTSKLMAVGDRDEARQAGHELPDDIDAAYLFGQIAIHEPVVDWRGNCGNLTAGVALFAVLDGIVAARAPVTPVRLLNLNTGVRVRCAVPSSDGRPDIEGKFAMAGVPGTGPRIDVAFEDPARGLTGRLLPTGRVTEEIAVRGAPAQVTIIDVTNPIVVVAAADLGLTGTELPAQLNSDHELLADLERLRGEAAVRCGLVDDPAQAAAQTPAVPRVVIVSEPVDHPIQSGDTVSAAEADVVARSTSMGVFHHAFTGTGLMAVAVAARLPGTVINTLARHGTGEVRVAHPKGVVTVSAVVEPGDPPVVREVSVPRTARLIMHGSAYPSPTVYPGRPAATR